MHLLGSAQTCQGAALDPRPLKKIGETLILELDGVAQQVGGGCHSLAALGLKLCKA